ncbi:MAG: hypothetical protein WD336_04020, partial [Trueperaceae bacterium]
MPARRTAPPPPDPTAAEPTTAEPSASADPPDDRPTDPDPTHDPAHDPAHDLALPDPLAFQRASLLLLVFRFQGKRTLVASRVMTSSDFAAELRAHVAILERYYGRHRVSAVEVVSYQHGRFYADPWPDGRRLLERLAPTLRTDRSDGADAGGADEARDDAGRDDAGRDDAGRDDA